MKKRKGPSLPKALRQQSTSYSSPSIVRRAREYPLLECIISADWQNEQPGLVEIVVARQQPDGNICFGTYLVDKLCLGLKNTFARANYTPARYQDESRRLFRDRPFVTCSSTLAYQMIYESIDYAARFGFTPQRDYELTQFMLAPRDEYTPTYKIHFGQKGNLFGQDKGKPLFISGPDDNVPAILKQLEQTAGPGNYNFIAMAPPPF